MSKLQAGAAKCSITPPAEMMPGIHFFGIELEGVYQNLYVRALVAESGGKKIAVITYDTGDMSRTADMCSALGKAYGFAPQELFFAATHTHEAPSFASEHHAFANDTTRRGWVVKYGDFVIAQTVECVGAAMAALRPARWGYGSGNSYVNVCRDQRFENGVWGEGRDYEAPSDKTLAVLKFVGANGGLIAAVLNYAVHGTVCFLKKDEKSEKYLISGDFPGMMSEYLEERYADENAVFLWTSGAAGNQNPLFHCSYSMFAPNGSPAEPVDAGYASWKLCEHLAQTQALDAVRILNDTDAAADSMAITTQTRTLTLPGHTLVYPGGREPRRGVEPFNGAIEDGPPVVLKLNLITLDDVALFGINGELDAAIGLHMKAASPLKNTIIVGHTAERVGYLPTKQSYENRTFAFYASFVKDGVTEEHLLPVFLEMIEARQRA
jgi:hypothetical protein